MELKKIIFNMWKTGFYHSKSDLFKIIKNFNVYTKQNILDNIEEVLTNKELLIKNMKNWKIKNKK